MLGAILILAGIVSMVLFLATVRLQGNQNARVAAVRRWLAVYSLIITLFVTAGILWFLGVRRGGSPAFRESSRAGLDWLGYYDAASVPMRFTADGGNTSLKLPRLGDGDVVTLTPSPHPPRNESIDWKLTATVSSEPLRVNGVCINVPAKNWLLDRDVIVIEEASTHTFFTLEFIDHRRFLKPVYAIRYNQGTYDAKNVRHYDLKGPVEIWSTAIASDRTLAAMLRTLDRHRKPPKEIPAWNLFRRIAAMRRGSFDNLLTPGTGRDIFFTRLSQLNDLAKDAIWVREEADQNSRSGLLIANPALWAQTFQIVRTSNDGSSYSMLDAPPNLSVDLPEHSSIELGSGSLTARQRFLLPSQWSRDRISGNVADVFVRNQPRWELPPNAHEPFVIMSAEADVPVSGYNLDIGMLRQPFYAKAQMNPNGSFAVNDGRDQHGTGSGTARPALEPGEMFRLGAAHTGALLMFRLTASPVPFAGLWCIAILLVISGLFFLTLWKNPISDPVGQTAWTILLHLVIVILFTRVLLIYRIAVLPPSDASAPIRGLFEQSLRGSLLAFAAVPLVMLLVRWISRSNAAKAFGDLMLRQQTIRSVDAPTGVVVAATMLVGWSLVVIGTGANESVGPLRVNVVTQVLSLIALALGASWMTALPRWHRAAAALTWCAIPIILMVVIVGDHGFLINGMAMIVVVFAVMLWDRYRKLRWYEWAIVAVFTVTLVAVVAFRERILIGIMSDSFVERVASPKESYVYYRIAATSAGRERLLEKIGDPDDFRFDMYRRNAAHHWQMLLYASEGAMHPKGYGGARLSRVGMSYPTSLSDSMFAIHLLPEHGLPGGLGLLLVYLAAAIMAMGVGGSLPKNHRPRAITLIAFGAHLIFTTLYMASTNLGQLVFTGQNIPMLSLGSGSDVVAAAVLLALITVLAHSSVRAQGPQLFAGSPWLRRISVITIALAAAWCLSVAVTIYRVGADEERRKPLRFPSSVIKAYREHLPGASPNPSLVLQRGRLVPKGPLTWIEQKFVEQFNESPDHYDRNGGFYYLARTPMGEPAIRINERYFSIASPFHPPRRWNGIIRYGAESYPTLNVLGSDVQIHPGRAAQPESIALSKPPDARHEYSSHLLLKLTDKGPSLCELTLDNGKASVITMRTRSPQAADWQVRVDGEEQTTAVDLKGGEIIRIDGRTLQGRHARPFSYSLLYLGKYEPVLAATRWRNGEMKRIVHAGTLGSVVSDIGAALDTEIAEADDAETTERRLPRAVNLSIDMPLQNELDTKLATAGPPIYDAVPGQRRKVLAISVMDAFSGDVLAMSSWQPPGVEPERNWNIRNHAIGSTIKPILLSTIAAGYEGSGFDVTEFAAVDRSDCAAPEGTNSIHPHCMIAGIALEAPPWDCNQSRRSVLDTRLFIVESRNFMAVTLGMLGMVTNPADWKQFLAPYKASARTAAFYRGTEYTLSLPDAPSAAFTSRDPLPSPLPEEASHSILFTTMPRLFHVTVPRTATLMQMEEQTKQDLALYAPSLAELTVGKNYYVDDVLPDRIDLLPHDLQSTRRDLLPFFLGGGREGFWSSVRMSEAVARITTGLKVHAHIEHLATPRTADGMPLPLANAAWRQRNIVEPMTMVGRTDASLPNIGPLEGNAAGLGEFVDFIAPHGKTYRAMFKTGTLDERDTDRYESEMLMFVIGETQNGAFVRARTISGYMYMADTKIKSIHQWQRGDLAKPILQTLVNYLATRPDMEKPSATANDAKSRKP